MKNSGEGNHMLCQIVHKFRTDDRQHDLKELDKVINNHSNKMRDKYVIIKISEKNKRNQRKRTQL